MKNATTNTIAKRPAISAEVVDNMLVIEFANGEKLDVYPEELSTTIRATALLHGLKQKLVDAGAIARNPDTGMSATLADKIAAVREVYDRITSPDGTWNKVREGGTGNGGNGGLLLRALMQMSGKSKVDIEAFLETKSKEEKAALRANPKVAAIIAELQREKASVNSDELLDELM